MKLWLVAAGWLGAAAVAAGFRFAADWLGVERPRDGAAATAAHLGSQRCMEASLALELAADPLELRGTLRATVVDAAPFRELHLIAPPEVDLESVSVDGAPAEESTTWLAGLIAAPRAHRRFRLAARTAEPSAAVEIVFRRALPGPGGEPLPAVVDPLAQIELACGSQLSQVALKLPEGVSLITSGGGPDERIEGAAGSFALGEWPAGHAPLVFGAGKLATRASSQTPSRVRFVAAEGDLPEVALEVEAREWIAQAVGRFEEPPRVVVIRRGLEPGAIERLGGGWFGVAAPRGALELAHALLATSLAASPDGDHLELDPLTEALPAALLLDAVPKRGEPGASLPRLSLSASGTRGLRAWRALTSLFGARARDAARELFRARLTGAADRPALLSEPAMAAIVAWAQGGVALSLENWRLSMRHGRSLASGQIVVRPPPPPLSAPLPIALTFFGQERIHSERVLLGGARTPFDGVDLEQPPRVIALDVEGSLPHRGVAPAIVPLTITPCAFAVAADASELAVALLRGGSAPLCGVSALHADPQGTLELRRWQPTAEAPRALEWVVPGRFLLLRDQDGAARVIDERDGSSVPFDHPSVAPRGGLLLESREHAPGCFAHQVHDIDAGLAWPLPVPGRGAVRWVEGSEELVAAGADGRATILDSRGRPRLVLPLSLGALRVLRREPFGWVAAVDTLAGGRVELFDGQGRRLRSVAVEGRIRAASFSAESGALLVFTELAPHDHAVTRVEVAGTREGVRLYRGADRPLAPVHSTRGLLLVSAERDELPPGEPRRLEFVAFEELGPAGAPAAARRLVSTEALLEPPPVVASAGRYLYYLRAQGGPRAQPGETRPRALHRYDFLSGREEPLAITSR